MMIRQCSGNQTLILQIHCLRHQHGPKM